ncbi:MAG: ABC transporter substrate-binding protein [Firmicutes bacterium]|nr:ABC transporter substrate-binding protein [Bacillota bacterium]
MKQLKRIGMLLMVGVMFFTGTFFLVGCGGRNNDDDRMLLTPGRLIVATNAQFAPFTYMNAEGNVVGAEAEIAQIFANQLGVELEMRVMDFGAMLLSVQTRQVDLVMSTVTMRLDRLRNVNFTNPYFNAGQMIFGRPNNITVNDDMTNEQLRAALNVSGVRIAMQANTTGHLFVLDNLPNATAVAFDNVALAVAAFEQGDADFVMLDNVLARRTAEESPTTRRLVDVRLSYEQYGYAVRKGNYELLHTLNQILARIQMDGTARELFARHGLVGGIYF